MKFTDKAKASSLSKFFKTLKEDLSDSMEEAVGVVVEKEASSVLDDFIATSGGKADDELVPFIRDELATVGKEIGAEAAIAALPKATRLALNEAMDKATKTFERSLKSQEARLKKLMDDPEAATAKAMAEIRANIAKTASREAAKAVQEATKELKKAMRDKVKEFGTRKKLHARDLKEGNLFEGDMADTANQILGRIIGTPAGRMPYDVAPQKIDGGSGAGKQGLATPLHKRAFGIPDLLIEDALVMDAEQVMKMYVRSMSSDLALVEKFGSIEMIDQVKKIQEDYTKLKANAADDKSLQKLAKEEERDIRDLMAIRDRIRHTEGLPDDPTAWTAKMGKGLLQSRGWRRPHSLDDSVLLHGQVD